MKSRRLKFFLFHLAVSLIIAFVVVGLVFCVWYPTPLALAVGVTHIFLMMLLIDVVVGPILGFIVYKEGKKTLKFDLFVVVFIQILALGFGVYSIAQGRPIWIVYTNDRFELVRKNEIIQNHLSSGKIAFKDSIFFKPQYAAVKYSYGAQKSNDVFTEVLGGVSLAQFPERYVPLENVKPQIQQRAQNLEALKNFNDAYQVEETIKKYPQADAWLPLKANAVDMAVLINRGKGEVVKIVDLRPWK